MRSYEVLRDAITGIGAKSVAADMELSPSMIYRWCEAADNEDASGARNPLDRVVMIHKLTGDSRPIQWLCKQANGFFVENPPVRDDFDEPVFDAIQKMLKEFSDLLQGVTDSMRGDGDIGSAEAETLRTEWEELKAVAEGFITAYERGEYRDSPRT